MNTKIISWNCRGFCRNLDEIRMLTADYHPVALCLQETFLRPESTVNLRKYSQYHSFSTSTDDRAIGGSSVLVRKEIAHREVRLNTDLQAVAVSMSLQKTFTICSLYLPPRLLLKVYM